MTSLKILTTRCIVPLVHTIIVQCIRGCQPSSSRLPSCSRSDQHVQSRPTELRFVQGSMTWLVYVAHLTPKAYAAFQKMVPCCIDSVSTSNGDHRFYHHQTVYAYCIRNTSLNPDPTNGLPCHSTIIAQTPHLARPNFGVPITLSIIAFPCSSSRLCAHLFSDFGFSYLDDPTTA
jgi:hypothetical protein